MAREAAARLFFSRLLFSQVFCQRSSLPRPCRLGQKRALPPFIAEQVFSPFPRRLPPQQASLTRSLQDNDAVFPKDVSKGILPEIDLFPLHRLFSPPSPPVRSLANAALFGHRGLALFGGACFARAGPKAGFPPRRVFFSLRSLVMFERHASPRAFQRLVFLVSACRSTPPLTPKFVGAPPVSATREISFFFQDRGPPPLPRFKFSVRCTPSPS